MSRHQLTAGIQRAISCKRGEVMGQTSAGVTWPVWTGAGAWEDCCDEPCKRKKCNRHLWARLWPAYYKCDADHRIRE